MGKTEDIWVLNHKLEFSRQGVFSIEHEAARNLKDKNVMKTIKERTRRPSILTLKERPAKPCSWVTSLPDCYQPASISHFVYL